LDSFEALKAKIYAETGFHCDQYKERPFKRRLAVRMRANRVETYEDYLKVLEAKPQEYEALLDALTINLSKFFRNPETYAAVEAQVLPNLTADCLNAPEGRKLLVFSAGCASGEEPYSLAMLLEEHFRKRGRRCTYQIIGTDIDRVSLLRARKGEYGSFALSECPPEIVTRYFEGNGSFQVLPAVRSQVTFLPADLTDLDRPGVLPRIRQLDLLFFRNVLIYMERRAQERMLTAMAKRLRPGGYLVLGKVETLMGEPRNLYEVVNARERIFRRRPL
jgi:chemotaxis methyl-accepting protein methylase